MPPATYVFYASRLMKGWEVRLVCKKFREQEAALRRARFRAVNGGCYQTKKWPDRLAHDQAVVKNFLNT